MKNISKKIALLSMVCLAFTGCKETDDYWAEPQAYPQEDAVTIPGFTATGVSAINLADVTGETVKTFSLSDAALPEGFALANARIVVTPADITGEEAEIATSVDGLASVADLQALVESTYGKRPDNRAFNAHAYVNAVQNGQAVLIDAGTFALNVTPVAPQISNAYYVIGGISGTSWDVSNTSLQFNHSGSDVYEDPIFTITVPVAEGENWFAITDAISIDYANNNGGNWDQVIGCAEGNGNNGTEGSVARRSQIGDDGSFKVVVNGDAKFIKITLNMMEYTYKIEKLNFQEYFYEIGNESGWGTSHALRSPNFDGKYQGYYYLNGEFKFKPNKDDWNGDYEYDSEGKIADNGGANCPDPGAGFYQIDVDLTLGTYNLTQVNSITCVGNHNGWNVTDAACHMTYNSALGCWELTTQLKDGFKFAMNDDWTISWGGANGDPAAYGDLSQNNGKDLNVPNGEGTYKIQLYLSYEGNNRVVLTKQ